MEGDRGGQSLFALRILACLVGLALADCATGGAPTPPTAFHIVALGDSFASGQGAPDENFTLWKYWTTPRWDDKRCNRSSNAPTALAVKRLTSQGYSVTYESFACSGASIMQGLLGPFMGPEPPPGAQPLPPQVDQLEALVSPPPTSPPTPPTRVDAVTLVAGGNDILFEYIVMVCMVERNCRMNHGVVDALLSELGPRLDLLAQGLAATKIPTGHVLLLEYPDPTQDSDGTYCNGKPPGDPLALLSEEDVKWAAESILPRLNHALCEAAKRNGWTYVGHIATEFHKHGWCPERPENWINTISESVTNQLHYRGGMHPNPDGYAVSGEKLAEAILPLIHGQTPPVTDCQTFSQE